MKDFNTMNIDNLLGTGLPTDSIFVYGSNINGQHGGGKGGISQGFTDEEFFNPAIIEIMNQPNVQVDKNLQERYNNLLANKTQSAFNPRALENINNKNNALFGDWGQKNFKKMAKNDFSAEAASNYEQKCLCVLVLDISGSMSGTPIVELNRGLQDFYKEISEDDSTNQKLEVSLITFNHTVTTLQEPALVENFKIPTLEANGSTAMVDAVNEAIQKVQARKDWYKSTGQPYYRPWIILMTDGEPDKGQDVDGLASRIKADMENSRYVFLPIGVQGANMSVLNKIAGLLKNKETGEMNQMGPMPLEGAKFSQFFKWLSASMGQVVNNPEGTPVDLTKGGTDWMKAFTI